MIDSKIWGPSLWYFIHTLSYNYIETYKKEYQLFFNYLKYLIPCPVCKQHYNSYILIHPLNLKTKDNFIKWCFLFHNSVNRRLDYEIITIEHSDKLYETINNKIILKFLKIFIKKNLNNLLICKKFLVVILEMYPDTTIKTKFDIAKLKNATGLAFFIELNKIYKLLEN
tara:strand:- start:1268 stop:1774 length:507 start_codon:yes stop_codon:yes gene_type:complete